MNLRGLLNNIKNIFSHFDKWQNDDYCLAMVQDIGLNLKYVKKQTPEICLAAVQQNGYALEYVREQTPEICLAAVQQNGYALEFVEDQTPEICIAAMKQNPDAAKFVELPVDSKQRTVFLKKLIFLMNTERLDTGVLKKLKEQL